MAVPMVSSAEGIIFGCFKRLVASFRVAGVALRGVSKVTKLEEVSHEMLVFLRPRVSSRVSGFPVASPRLWGKLQNISFLKASKQVVMSFCVAGEALCAFQPVR